MYTGDNKTALHSQKAMADALVRLLQRRSYPEITVSELCQESGISRQTFYILFQTKENVLRFEILHNYAYPDMPLPPGEVSLARYMAHTFAVYTDANYDFLKLLTDNGLGYVFYSCCTEWMARRQDFLTEIAPGNEHYLQIYIASTVTGFLNAYLTEGIRRNTGELETLLHTLFSGSWFRRTIQEDLRPMP